jgi:glycosyltransferase involved in cell wall biosynthesis
MLLLLDELLPAGTERQAIALAERLPRDTFEPVIGVLQSSRYLEQLELKTPVINFQRRGLPLLKSLRLVKELREHLCRERYDIVQSYMIDSAILGGLAVKFTKPKPILIGTRRNTYYWIDNRKATFQLYRRVGQWSDHILANSQQTADLCAEVEEIERKRVQVIHNGIDVDRFRVASPANAKMELGLEGKNPLIGVIGNWRPVKGLDVFLRAAALVCAKLPTAQFVLIGEGALKSDLQVLAHQLGLEERLTFIEGRSDIHRIVSALDVAVQCSLSESFSNVLVEYMAAARPIVATAVGDAANMIEEGKEGLLVPPNDHQALSEAILKLCSDPAHALEMGWRAAEKAVANWAWERILAAHQSTYLSLVDGCVGRG